MSEPVTAMGGVAASGGIAGIREAERQGMVTLRGDLSAPAVGKAVKSVTGMAVPGAGTFAQKDGVALCWMSPDELLVLCDYGSAEGIVQAFDAASGKAHLLAVNVSDARASFQVSGEHARDVMAKLCPVDLAPGAFGTGMFRRTRLAQVAAAIWMPSDDSFQLICFRSQAQYVFDLLSIAAQPGSEVNHLCSTG
ncbi:sarcosine oxidase subunit gamma [uncultured Roseobacter sp.]|uniref:sarcosine oxidase subunit gamma n=1 Tax=uncultured Roseobacter sp. TaxID=114847 RepID=UPI0026326195|nr:sarcosine oxidase subunit gamma family protein [uncultured Roseobacter sp.]